MAVAELGDDMTSLREGNTRLLKPGKDFREGTYVFYRYGRYHFLWSVDDTRSPNYSVAYGWSNSPAVDITIPASNIILEKDLAAGIYGTGHNSVVQQPSKKLDTIGCFETTNTEIPQVYLKG